MLCCAWRDCPAETDLLLRHETLDMPRNAVVPLPPPLGRNVCECVSTRLGRLLCRSPVGATSIQRSLVCATTHTHIHTYWWAMYMCLCVCLQGRWAYAHDSVEDDKPANGYPLRRSVWSRWSRNPPFPAGAVRKFIDAFMSGLAAHKVAQTYIHTYDIHIRYVCTSLGGGLKFFVLSFSY